MRYMLVLLAGLIVLRTFGKQPSYDTDALLDAIYTAEGGIKTSRPYGIKSRSLSESRAICRNTIINTKARWVKAGCPGDFIEYLGNRYCPPSVDPVGNKNWIRNVKRELRQ